MIGIVKKNGYQWAETKDKEFDYLNPSMVDKEEIIVEDGGIAIEKKTK
jgi:hypothetical protein